MPKKVKAKHNLKFRVMQSKTTKRYKINLKVLVQLPLALLSLVLLSLILLSLVLSNLIPITIIHHKDKTTIYKLKILHKNNHHINQGVLILKILL